MSAYPDTVHITIDDINSAVLNELDCAMLSFAPMNSTHEGYAILKEEVDELWDEVKTKPDTPGRTARIKAEAIQVAAMAIRFVLDVCDESEPPAGPSERGSPRRPCEGCGQTTKGNTLRGGWFRCNPCGYPSQ